MGILEKMISDFDFLNNDEFFEDKLAPHSYFELRKSMSELRYIFRFMESNYDRFKKGNFIP
jgi:hypothetical protein